MWHRRPRTFLLQPTDSETLRAHGSLDSTDDVRSGCNLEGSRGLDPPGKMAEFEEVPDTYDKQPWWSS